MWKNRALYLLQSNEMAANGEWDWDRKACSQKEPGTRDKIFQALLCVAKTKGSVKSALLPLVCFLHSKQPNKIINNNSYALMVFHDSLHLVVMALE